MRAHVFGRKLDGDGKAGRQIVSAEVPIVYPIRKRGTPTGSHQACDTKQDARPPAELHGVGGICKNAALPAYAERSSTIRHQGREWTEKGTMMRGWKPVNDTVKLRSLFQPPRLR